MSSPNGFLIWKIALSLAYLGTSYGRRVQKSNQLLQNGPLPEGHERLKTLERRRRGGRGDLNAEELLAAVLLGCHRAAAFNSPGVSSLVGRAGHSGVLHFPETKGWCHTARSVRMDAAQPRVSIDKERSNLITIAPPDDKLHTASFIGPIHGLGDNNMGWADVALQFHQRLPYVKFLLPNAPISPVTLNGGMSMPSWFDITSLDEKEAQQPCDGIEESRARIVELIEEEVQKGIPLSRIVVGGFSQGGAMSLYTGLQYPGQLAGVVCMSGWLANADAFKLSPAAASTPVGQFHGLVDPTVRFAWAKQSELKLREMGCVDYTMTEYADLGHSASAQEIEDILSWLKARLPPL